MYLKLFFGTVLLINEITSTPITTYNREKQDIFTNEIDKDNAIAKYQVTENVIDIPDDRTLAPILANYNINTGLNYGNVTIKQNKTIIDKEESWNREDGNPNNEAANIDNKNKEDKVKEKKNQFSLLHIKAEYDDHKIDTNDKCDHVFRCLKDYFFGVKKGFVDGIHSLLNKRKDSHAILDKFHRNIHNEESSFSDEFDF